MKEILSNIMAPQAPTSITATVVRRLGPGRYELRDDLERIFPAIGAAVYAPGATVIVQSGRIVARSGSPVNIKTYEV